MPIEIKELHIRVAVSAGATTQTQPAASAPGSGKQGGSGDKDAFVAECVEQVLQILQTKAER